MAVLFALGALAAGRNALAFSINQMRFGAHPDKTRMVLELSDKAEFRAFMLSSPYRLVIDLPSFEWRAGLLEASPASRIKEVRHGNLQPGISRIVFDLDSASLIRGAFILPRQQATPDRLVIDFVKTTPEEFERRKSEVHGTLFTGGGQPAISQAQTPPPAPAPIPRAPAGQPRYNGDPAPYQTASAALVPPPKPQGKIPLVVVDPGHGGVDPGAPGANNTFEKNVTLALAKELKRQLEDTGRYRVLLTRDRDIFIKLGDRVKFARDNGADLFVSIHADSIGKSAVHGASVYTLSEKASDAQTEKLAARENRADLIAGIDLSVEDQDVANILVDLAMRDTMNQSKFFAGKLVDTMENHGVSTLDSPHRSAGFAVLKAADIPSVLIEAGFMSNRKESALLNSDDYRRKVAAAIRGGIDAYFEQVRKNQRI